jgi:hypothetical protein
LRKTPNEKARRLERRRQVIRRQHKALATEDSYVFWLRRYIAALHTIPAGARQSPHCRFLAFLVILYFLV